ncbi:MAG: response regulator [Pseudoclavibacter sp.]
MGDATRSIRVLVVDDHPVVRAGLIGLLDDEPDLEVVGQAASGDAAVGVARAVQPDVVLMDLRMPGLGGAEATVAVLEAAESARVLVVTSYDTDDEILSAIDAGASGYVLKSAPADEILEAVRRVAAGEVALAPAVAARLVAQTRRSRAKPGAGRSESSSAMRVLSARETEVLRLVALGRSNAAIGRDLFIGEATVKTHLSHIFEKLEVRDRTRAVTKAMELGLL